MFIGLSSKLKTRRNKNTNLGANDGTNCYGFEVSKQMVKQAKKQMLNLKILS